MRLPLRWLEAYVPVTLPPRELAERLTMSGSLVERVERGGDQWDDILVGRVAALVPHPNADTLFLATIDLGDRTQTVVTGAPNLVVGALVPFVGVGGRLPGEGRPLEGRVLRGIRSEGMVCSERELGLGEDHGGILMLDGLLGVRALQEGVLGRSLAELLGEWVLEVEITPNRPDCLSVFGLAREVAAVTGATLRPPVVALREVGPRASELAAIRIEAPDLCSRYVARVVTGVVVGPSPAWLVERLRAAGVRAINNVVDVTNYVMLELGQPLHAFDLDQVGGQEIVVRRAQPGEVLTTLDGVARVLGPEMLVIADGDGAIGLAGVMGGGNSEVSEATTRVLLEAATFDAVNTRRASVALGLRTEASSRFEKGLPRRLALWAADRAAALMAELAGGSVAAGALVAGEEDPEPRVIVFDLGEVARLLGVEWSVERIVGSLVALGFGCGPLAGGRVAVSVPWWREDVVESADLVEEVARVVGFEAIPETLLRGGVAPRPVSPGLRWGAPVRQTLLACGLCEGSSPGLTGARGLEMLRPEGLVRVAQDTEKDLPLLVRVAQDEEKVGHSLVRVARDEEWLALVVPNADAVRAAGGSFRPLRVVNPLSPEREWLRVLLLPGLLDALRDNLRAGEDRVAFFELDVVHFPRGGDLPVERRSLALAMVGERAPRSWAAGAAVVDFFDLKGVVEALLRRLGVSGARFVVGGHPLLHPGRSALLEVEGVGLGFLGELHPVFAGRWDLGAGRACVAEFDFDALAARASEARAFVDFSRLPSARRDLAVVVDALTPAGVVEQVVWEAKGRLARVTLFDVYEGDQVPLGRKSLAFALEFQDAVRTLTEDEVERAVGRVRRALEHRVGATFR